MRERSEFVIRLTRNEERFDANFANLFKNNINSRYFKIEHFGFRAEFQKHEAKLTNINCSLQYRRLPDQFLPTPNPQTPFLHSRIISVNAYYRVTYEIHFRPVIDEREPGWNVSILDQGKRVLGWPGKPDRRGGIIDINSVPGPTDLRERLEATDSFQQPPGKNVLLGGDGLELYEAPNFEIGLLGAPVLIDIIRQEPIFHVWRIYEETDFRRLQL